MTTSVVTSKGPRPFLEQWRDAVSGSTAGMVSVLALHPLDVIKTRLQGASPTLNRTETFPHSAAARDPEPSSPNVRPIPPRLPLHSPRSHRQAAGDVQGNRPRIQDGPRAGGRPWTLRGSVPGAHRLDRLVGHLLSGLRQRQATVPPIPRDRNDVASIAPAPSERGGGWRGGEPHH